MGKLCELLGLSRRGNKDWKIPVKLGFVYKHGKKDLIMALQLKDTQKAPITAVGVNAVGNKVPTIYGPVAWSTSNPELLDIVPQGNFDCEIVTKGPLGTCVVNAQAWADEGKLVEITGTLDVEVVASQATALRLEAGVPTIR